MIRSVSLAALLVAGLAVPAAAQDDPVDLRFAVWLPPTHPLLVGVNEWIEAIKEASDGSINITLYPAEQLGRAFDHYDLARDGIADISFVNPGYNAGRFPVISYGETPFLFNEAEAGSRAFDEWYRPYAEQEMSDVQFCMAFIHSPGTMHMVDRVERPADLRGKSVRPANGTLGQYLTSQGATTVQASAAEMRDLLSRGTADGTASPYSSLITWGISDFATFHLDMPMYVANFAIIMSPTAYGNLSDAQRQIMDDHCNTQWAGDVVQHWAAEDIEEREVMEADENHEFYVPTEEQRAEWLEAVEPVIQRWTTAVSGVGQDPEAIRAAMDEALERNGAGL